MIGNTIRNGLDSDFEKKLFSNYWEGNGDYTLSNEEFELIVSYAETLTPTSAHSVDIWEQDLHYTVKQFSFYGNANYDQALGTATLIYDTQSGNAVGFYDYYNFDPKPIGVRSYSAEFQTRAVKYAGERQGARPFSVRYGAVK